MQHDAEFYFVEMMRAITEPLIYDIMTDQQAAMDAIADHRTEQQEEMMGIGYECL